MNSFSGGYFCYHPWMNDFFNPALLNKQCVDCRVYGVTMLS